MSDLVRSHNDLNWQICVAQLSAEQ